GEMMIAYKRWEPRLFSIVMMVGVLLILFAGLARPALGQSDANKGQISGTVYDPKQALVPGAKVQIANTATAARRELITNEVGQFRAVLLDPGSYDITVDVTGFDQASLKGVILHVGSAIDLPINLKLGGVTETVEVSDTLVGTSMPAPSTIISTA